MFVAIMFLVVNEAPRAGQVGRPNADPALSPEVLTCLVMWMSSFAAATLLTMWSVLIAWRHRVKVWISGEISVSQRQNEWPPRPTLRQRPNPNLLKWWIIGSGIGLFVGLFIGGIILLMTGLDAMNRQPRIANNGGGGAALFGGLVGAGAPIISAILIIFVGSRILERIGANSPAECWPLGELIAESNPSD